MLIRAIFLVAFLSSPILAAESDDPYLWLEEVEGARALAWVKAQHAKTVSRFGSDARFVADRDALVVIFGRSDNIPYPARQGGKLFNFWKDAAHPRGLWRTTSLESFRTDAPNWNVLLDVDALARLGPARDFFGQFGELGIDQGFIGVVHSPAPMVDVLDVHEAIPILVRIR